jgi:hypothetical protein
MVPQGAGASARRGVQNAQGVAGSLLAAAALPHARRRTSEAWLLEQVRLAGQGRCLAPRGGGGLVAVVEGNEAAVAGRHLLDVQAGVSEEHDAANQQHRREGPLQHGLAAQGLARVL